MFTSYDVDNDKRFATAIEDALQASGSLKIPFRIIANDFYKSEKAIFKLKSPGQYPPFGGMRPNAPTKYHGTLMTRNLAAIMKKKEKYGFAYPLLLAEGALMNSVTQPNARGSILDIKDTYMLLGTNIKYGVYHQSDATRKKIPLRKFLFVGPESSRYSDNQEVIGRTGRWVKTMNEYMFKVLIKVGDEK